MRECEVIMSVRWIGAALLFFLAASPAMAEVESATDKIVGTFMALDSDQSDSVSYDEYKAMVDQRAKALFKTMDANRDGQVTDEEYRAFWRKTKAKWYRLKR